MSLPRLLGPNLTSNNLTICHRLGTPPNLNPAGLNGPPGPSATAPAGPAPAGPAVPQQLARAAPIVEATGSSSLAVGGFSQSLGKCLGAEFLMVTGWL